MKLIVEKQKKFQTNIEIKYILSSHSQLYEFIAILFSTLNYIIDWRLKYKITSRYCEIFKKKKM